MYSIAASFFEPLKVVCVDIDDDALGVAKENIEHYELTDEIQMIKGDLLRLLDGAEEPAGGEAQQKPPRGGAVDEDNGPGEDDEAEVADGGTDDASIDNAEKLQPIAEENKEENKDVDTATAEEGPIGEPS